MLWIDWKYIVDQLTDFRAVVEQHIAFLIDDIYSAVTTYPVSAFEVF